MAELFPISLAEQIECVERELTMRQRVYARRVSDKKMTQAQAEREISRMKAVLKTLRWSKDFAEKADDIRAMWETWSKASNNDD